jgi:glycosyltransferase involved in cell wall biosynthesis
MYSIIMPAYNEADRIKAVLESYVAEFAGQELIVVCDGFDNTRRIVEETAKGCPDIRILGFQERLGKGGAIIEGFKAAQGRRIGFADADESVSPRDLKNMFELLDMFDELLHHEDCPPRR